METVRILYTLIIFTLITETAVTFEIREHSNKRRPKGKGGFQKNICDITDRNSQVHCYCENTRELRNATKAECWIFNGGIPYDDPIWQSFSSQPTLTTLSFNVRVDGALGYVPTKALQYLYKLEAINIKYGNIGEVKSYAFTNLTSLREVTLSQNQIEQLQQYAFAHLPNLVVINLKENMIVEIGRDSFFDVQRLQKIIFTKNNISSISNGAFQHAFDLVELELNENNIFTLNRHTFDGLANLRKLDLRQNRIYNLTEFTFAELWNLQELLLGKNYLKYLSQRAFDGLSQLKKLSLDDNKLTSLPTGLFEGVRGLNTLDLRSNLLYSLAYDNIKPILDNLKSLDSNLLLEENKFICDCRLKWMHVLSNETKSQYTKDSLESVTCKMDQPIVSSAYSQQPDDNLDKIIQNISMDSIQINVTNRNMEELKHITNDLSSKRSFNRNILKIPPETLLCSIEMKKTTVIPYIIDQGFSIQNEMKTFLFQDTNSARKTSFVYYLLIWNVGLVLLM